MHSAPTAPGRLDGYIFARGTTGASTYPSKDGFGRIGPPTAYDTEQNGL